MSYHHLFQLSLVGRLTSSGQISWLFFRYSQKKIDVVLMRYALIACTLSFSENFFVLVVVGMHSSVVAH